MAYTKTTWANNDPNTPLDEVHLNKIENGIESVHTVADINAVDIGNVELTLDGHESRLDDLDGTGGDIDTINSQISALTLADINTAKYHEWRIVNSDPMGTVAAENVDNIFVGWAGAVTISLPAVPTSTDRIKIVDAGCDFSTNTLTVLRNGKNIMGTASDYTFSNQYGSIEFCWTGNTYGWVVTRSV